MGMRALGTALKWSSHGEKSQAYIKEGIRSFVTAYSWSIAAYSG